jgi:hypothetical protein
MRKRPRPAADSGATNSPPPVALPVVAHPRRLIVFFLVLATVAAASFVAGAFVRAPQQSALDAVSDQLEVTYAVEERIVAPGVTLPGRVVSGETRQLTVASGSGAGAVERLVVTRQTLVAGQAIAPGTLLGEVSGRPQISIPEGVPLYRDLVDGSTGADVTAFQSALQEMGLDASVTGEVGPRTLAAVVELYERFDTTLAAPTVISWSEFLPVTPGATVVNSAAVGTVLTPELPLATVKVSPDVVLARANVLEADQLTVGQAVQLRSGTGTAATTVQHIGEFTTPEDNSGAGRDVTMEIPADFVVTESAPITISADGDAKSTPAVPVLALRQDDKGIYVELPNDPSESADGNGSNTTEREKVYVTVTAQAEGWAAIEPDEQLAIGAKVYVSP